MTSESRDVWEQRGRALLLLLMPWRGHCAGCYGLEPAVQFMCSRWTPGRPSDPDELMREGVAAGIAPADMAAAIADVEEGRRMIVEDALEGLVEEGVISVEDDKITLRGEAADEDEQPS